MNLGLNCRIFHTVESVIEELPEQLGYIRAYGWDFKKPKGPDGIYQRPDEARIDDFVELVTSRNLKVIWLIFTTKDGRTLNDEIEFIHSLMDRGVQFHAFQILGEMYLPKYRNGDLSKKAVVEQVVKEDLPSMLSIWVPAMENEFPEQKVFITCASHQGKTDFADTYRMQYTQVILDWANDNDYQGEFCFHAYSGYLSQAGGEEEAVYADINFNPIVNQIKAEVPNAKIHLCEGGYFRKDDSEIPIMATYYEAAREALGDDAIVVLHLLQGWGKFAWYSVTQKTNIGEFFLDYFSSPKEPVLIEFWENVYSFLFGTTYTQGLRFSDGSFKFNRMKNWFGIKRGYRVTDNDIGKTINEIKNNR